MFSGTVDFDPGTGITQLTANAQYDQYVVKLDPSGNFIWAKNFPFTGGNYMSYASGIISMPVTTDPSGNIILFGQFSGSNVDFDQGPSTYLLSSPQNLAHFISKLDANGILCGRNSLQTTADPGHQNPLQKQ